MVRSDNYHLPSSKFFDRSLRLYERLIRRPASTRFELVVDSAAAQYLQDWLADAAAGLR